MTHKKKKNIIIGALCGIMLLMVVGYAAFNSVLNIKGTSNISSNWDIKITNIETLKSNGATNVEGFPKYDNEKGLSATFNTNLSAPGDYATYKIEITNNGNLKAKLSNIRLSENSSKDVVFYLNKNENNEEITDALKESSILNKNGDSNNIGYVYVTVLYKDYENQQTPTEEDKKVQTTLMFDFEQANVDENGIALPGITTEELTSLTVDVGDGLYTDEYGIDRYVYKGANPDNYITFNNETWRILAIESDGTLKIMKQESIGNMEWDTSNSNNWTRPATLNTYLNDENDENSYYNSLSSKAKSLIQTHTWGIGPVAWNNTDLATQIESENSKTWIGKIALISLSDYFNSNSNMGLCGNFSLNQTNNTTCKQTTYIVPPFVTFSTINSDTVYNINSTGYIQGGSPIAVMGVMPVLYLNSNIRLEGKGTQDNPYIIA